VRAGLRHAVGESLTAGDLRGRAGICSEDIHTTIKAIHRLAISGILQQTVKGKYYENEVTFTAEILFTLSKYQFSNN